MFEDVNNLLCFERRQRAICRYDDAKITCTGVAGHELRQHITSVNENSLYF